MGLFHFTKEIYRYNNLIINLGVHDITISSDSTLSDPSVFLSFITKNISLPKRYFLQTSVGFGSGRINDDSHDYTKYTNHANLFFGLNIKTPWMEKRGNIDLMLEYIHGGINLGCNIPINSNMKFGLAITHIEKFYKFNDYKNKTTESIYGDDSGIAINFQYMIPNKNNESSNEPISLDHVSISEPENNCYIGLVKNKSQNPLIINDNCTVNAIKQIVEDVNNTFQTLNDSLMMLNQTITAHDLTNNYLDIKVKNLEDSVKIALLSGKISKSELNIAIKSLTNSLKYYYTNDHHLALKELDKTIQYLPNLAVAYARRGSIYYKLGDVDRATINWNYALQLDPEYKEVQNILKNMKQDAKNKEDIKLPE